MSDLSALLKAVILHPDDDTPRLVYADALEETEDPTRRQYAEYIRTACELNRLPVRKKDGYEKNGPCVLDDHGENYWSFETGRKKFAQGDRVDIKGLLAISDKPIEFLGLLVTKVTKSKFSQDVETVIVKRDEFSGPDPRPEVLKKEQKLFEDPVLQMGPFNYPYSNGLFSTQATSALFYAERGFWQEILCTPRYFLDRVVNILWHPDQKMACSHCEGKGTLLGTAGDRSNPVCTVCDGVKQVTVPLYVNAHPVTSIVLSEWPNEGDLRVYLSYRFGNHNYQVVYGGKRLGTDGKEEDAPDDWFNAEETLKLYFSGVTIKRAD